VLTPVFDVWQDAEVVSLTNAAYWRPQVSHTFHGRDIFAPVAAHLASGVPIGALGSPVRDPLRLSQPIPRALEGTVEGTVIWVDRFGNLVTNIPAELLAPGRMYRIAVGRITVTGLLATYAQARAGEPLALVGSHGYIEVAVREGTAAEMAGAGRGATVRVQAVE